MKISGKVRYTISLWVQRRRTEWSAHLLRMRKMMMTTTLQGKEDGASQERRSGINRLLRGVQPFGLHGPHLKKKKVSQTTHKIS